MFYDTPPYARRDALRRAVYWWHVWQRYGGAGARALAAYWQRQATQ